MTNDELLKQQSCHQEEIQTSLSSDSLSKKLFDPNKRSARERLYTFKEVPTTNEEHSNWEARTHSKVNKSNDPKRSPDFVTQNDINGNISELEMERQPDIMNSFSKAPPVALDSVKNIQFLGKDNQHVLESHLWNLKPEEFSTPKLPCIKTTFSNAAKYIEQRKKIIERSTFELKAERSVSCTDTNDSKILVMRRRQPRQSDIKECLDESVRTPASQINIKIENLSDENQGSISSSDWSYTNFLNNLKVPTVDKTKLEGKSKNTVPLSKSALSYDFNFNENYISPHDISVSILKEIERSKIKDADQKNINFRMNFEEDFSNMADKDNSKVRTSNHKRKKNRFLREDSVKLASIKYHCKKSKPKYGNKGKIRGSPANVSPNLEINWNWGTEVINSQKKMSNNMFVQMVHRMNEHQSHQFQMMLQCHYHLMSKMMDKMFD
jgi:hypothetical protein